jgi:hypothetical protein
MKDILRRPGQKDAPRADIRRHATTADYARPALRESHDDWDDRGSRVCQLQDFTCG